MKSFYIIMIGLTIGLNISCTRPSQTEDIEIPAHIIPLDKMSAIQADVLLINSYLKNLPHADSVNLSDSVNVYYKRIFQKYEISKGIYDSSLSFYENNIPLLNNVYKNSINRLNALENEQESTKDTP